MNGDACRGRCWWYETCYISEIDVVIIETLRTRRIGRVCKDTELVVYALDKFFRISVFTLMNS
jgi:hypothetical protein